MVYFIMVYIKKYKTFFSALRASCFQTISCFSNSTRVDITVRQHGKCFMFLKYGFLIFRQALSIKIYKW